MTLNFARHSLVWFSRKTNSSKAKLNLILIQLTFSFIGKRCQKLQVAKKLCLYATKICKSAKPRLLSDFSKNCEGGGKWCPLMNGCIKPSQKCSIDTEFEMKENSYPWGTKCPKLANGVAMMFCPLLVECIPLGVPCSYKPLVNWLKEMKVSEKPTTS